MTAGVTSEDWDRAYAACELTFSIEPHPDVEAALGALPPGSALELGCGEGRHAIWLATRGWRVMAVDFSPVAVNRGRLIAAHHGVDVSWVVADLADHQPVPPLDLVVILYLHIHPEALAAALGKAAAALAPGGTLFVLGWDRHNAAAGTGGPRPPEVLYALGELVAAVDGLQVSRAQRLPQVGSPDAVDALLVAHRPSAEPT